MVCHIANMKNSHKLILINLNFKRPNSQSISKIWIFLPHGFIPVQTAIRYDFFLVTMNVSIVRKDDRVLRINSDTGKNS